MEQKKKTRDMSGMHHCYSSSVIQFTHIRLFLCIQGLNYGGIHSENGTKVTMIFRNITSFCHLKEGFWEQAEFLTENVFIGLNPSGTDIVSHFILWHTNPSARNRL